MPFLSSTSWRWVCCWAQVPPQADDGHRQGSHSLWCGRAGMEFGRVLGRGLCYGGDGQPKSTGRQQGFASSQLRAEIRHRVSISDQRNQVVGASAFAAMDLVLGSGRGLSCLLAWASFSPWHRL